MSIPARLVLCGLFAAAGRELRAQDAVTLVGRWESVNTSQGGIGQVLEFTSAGQLVATPTVLLNGRYRTEGDRLIRHVPDAPEDIVVQLAVRGDTLLQWGLSQPDTQYLYRTPASKSRSGLVGQWSYRHYTGATAFEDYTQEGVWRFRLPMRTDTSSYRVRADTVVAQGGATVGRYRFSISDGKLRLEPLDQPAPAAVYNRAPTY